jgi:NADH:ubiquinone oxidoreductase subunit 2 (subunit N)
MKLEHWILIVVWVIALALIFTIPRNKRRLAVIAFLFKQCLTYLLGLVAVELSLLAYPVRELASINRTSFTYEFMAYPMVCAVFNSHYPNHRNGWHKFAYYAAYCTVLTGTEVLLEHNTDLVLYLDWDWWWTWLSLLATFWMTRTFCVLFFRGLARSPEIHP